MQKTLLMFLFSKVRKMIFGVILKEHSKCSVQILELIFAYCLSIMLVANTISYTSTLIVIFVCVYVDIYTTVYVFILVNV